jgi:hypothetical protein
MASRPRTVKRKRTSETALPRVARARAAKISITVDAAVLREVEHIARSSGTTVSAHVSEALARDLRRRRLAELLDEYEASAGRITEDELAEVRRDWLA